MARFYFHLADADGCIRDEAGIDLSGAEAAKLEAVKGARSIIAHDALSGELDLTGRIEVTDEHGAPVLTLPFAQAIAVRFPAWAERRKQPRGG